MSSDATAVTVGARRLALSNLTKVLWPATGFTKGEMIDYYARVAPVMLPHLAGRAMTLRRWPEGVDGPSWYEKHCPSHRPEWMGTVRLGEVAHCRFDEPAALVWSANMAAIELHPTLASFPDLECPKAVVLDLDPGPPADVVTCARLAVVLRDALSHLGLAAWAKTSGRKGLQLYVPLNTPVTYRQTSPWAHRLARLVQDAYPDMVVTSQDRSLRGGKVLIDWSQNSASKTTVAAYSLRAGPTPSVSAPVTFEELEAAARSGSGEGLRFSPEEVLARVESDGDLLAPVLALSQELPALG